MRRKVFNNVTLHVTANDPNVFLAVNFQVEQSRKETACFEALQKVIKGDIDCEPVGAAALYDARYEPISTSLTSGPLACPRPYRGVKIRDLTSHGYSPNCKRQAASKGVRP